MIIRVRTSVDDAGQRGNIRACRLREGIRRTRIGEEANDFQVWRRTDTGERVDARVDIVVGACTTSEDGIAVAVHVHGEARRWSELKAKRLGPGDRDGRVGGVGL